MPELKTNLQIKKTVMLIFLVPYVKVNLYKTGFSLLDNLSLTQ